MTQEERKTIQQHFTSAHNLLYIQYVGTHRVDFLKLIILSGFWPGSCVCACPTAGHEGTPWADGFDRKIWASGESACLFFVFILWLFLCIWLFTLLATELFQRMSIIQPFAYTYSDSMSLFYWHFIESFFGVQHLNSVSLHRCLKKITSLWSL